MNLEAVLFDRDGTLVEDVPYNADPDLIVLLPTVDTAITTCRNAGVKVGVVTNQSGVGRGYFDLHALDRMTHEIEHRLGGFDTWQTCPHTPQDDCACRKPRPGLITEACRELNVVPSAVAVIGDRRSDMLAARTAGCRGVFVGPARSFEFESATTVLAAVLMLLES